MGVRHQCGIHGVFATLLFASCSGLNPGSDSDTGDLPCTLQVAYVGPTTAGSFGGLQEDTTQCAAVSWRSYYAERPVPEKSLFVSPNCQAEADGSLERPYCTITEALAAGAQAATDATDDGLTVHVDPGTYTLNATIETAALRANITGLCSTNTILAPLLETAPLFTLNSDGGRFRLEGMQLAGGTTTLLHATRGTLSLRNVAITLSGDNRCLVVEGESSALEAKFVSIDGNQTTAVTIQAPTETSTSDATTQLPLPTTDTPRCLYVRNGGTATVESFALHDFNGVAAVVEDPGSSATLRDGVINDIHPLASDGGYGYGVVVNAGAATTLTGMTITGTYGVGVLAAGDASTLSINNTHVSGVENNIVSGSGVGVAAQSGATATVENTMLADNITIGAHVSSGASMTIDAADVQGNAINVVVADAQLTLTDSTLSDPVVETLFGGKVGVLIESLTAAADVTVTITGSILQDHPRAGLYIHEAAGGGMDLTITGNDFIDNGGDSGLASGAYAYLLSSGLTFSQNCYSGLGDPGLILDTATAQLDRNRYVEDYDNFAIQQQRCGTAIAPADIATEIIPSGAPSCRCGTRTDTGAECAPLPIDSHLLHDFGLGESSIAP